MFSHDAEVLRSMQNYVTEALFFYQSEKIKASCSASFSKGDRADKVPARHETRRPISAEFERRNESEGNKRSFITTPKASCHPQPAAQMSHWQPSHSWRHGKGVLQATERCLYTIIYKKASQKNRRNYLSDVFKVLFNAGAESTFQTQTFSGGDRRKAQVPGFCFCLFVLRPSFGIHGVKTIINAGIESFSSTDLLGQTHAGSLFISVSENQGPGEDWIHSSLLEKKVQTNTKPCIWTS